MARERTRRRAYGLVAPMGKVPIGPSVAILKYLHDDEGLTWRQIIEMVGAERSAIEDMVKREGNTTRLMAAKIEAALARYRASGPPRPGRVDATYTRWMMHSLEARGWPSLWVAEQMGRRNRLKLDTPHVFAYTEDALSKVFMEYHDQEGPSRRTAIMMWRDGHFPADCYEWDQDEPDLRPIPGSLRPELVAEALTFSRNVPKAQVKQVKMFMHSLGQWESERCARTSAANWAQHMGYEEDDYADIEIAHSDSRGVMCRSHGHNHDVPAIWFQPSPPTRATVESP